ncbi:MAG: cupin domain-containing protein [Oscillospiraceae bacterium]|nr:cupin domain-containing protein [Oscillospiraceae bacterium]
MLKKNGSYEKVVNEKMRGGEGTVTIEHFLNQEEMYNKGRLFARITVAPNSSIGYHVHEGEMETFHIISGTAKISDNGVDIIANVGDTVLTKSMTGHSVECVGEEPLVMVALIVFE